ncbi:uncharacterized protein At2g34160 [Neltuma alba]|uniref:uncharacterized protein At2g34160 n=1 Tax=Neltuma alba TaxID=207710 RepID=UPI0010A332AB|nr:uncharacterized protein At2g34160-like [Prosopis alba]
MTTVAANGNTEAPKKNVTQVAVNGNAEAAEKKSITTLAENGDTDNSKKNRIQVSNTKKPLFFYVNLAKRYIQQHNEVELSALGMAIATVVTIAEILKNNGLATEKKVSTSTVGIKDENKGRLMHKAKIEIVLGKSEKFDNLMAPATNPATKTASEAAVADAKKG